MPNSPSETTVLAMAGSAVPSTTANLITELSTLLREGLDSGGHLDIAHQSAQRILGIAAELGESADVTTKKSEPELLKPDGTPTPLGWKKIGGAFRSEMPTKTRTGKGGKTFEYITARQVAARIDAVVGPGNWATSVEVIRSEHPVSVIVGISVFGVCRHDVGYSNNPDADDESDRGFEDEPLKAAVSDGIKRAAVQWGIARWLYP